MTHPKSGNNNTNENKRNQCFDFGKSFEIKKDFLLFCFCLILVLAVSDGVLNFNP